MSSRRIWGFKTGSSAPSPAPGASPGPQPQASPHGKPSTPGPRAPLDVSPNAEDEEDEEEELLDGRGEEKYFGLENVSTSSRQASRVRDDALQIDEIDVANRASLSCPC